MITRMRDGTGRRHYRYLTEDTDRHGNVRVYFRRKGQPKIRLVEAPGTEEFDREYQLIFYGGSINVPIAKPIITSAATVKPPLKREGVVYIIGFDSHVKIGFTTNLDRRKDELQTGIPKKIKVYTSFSGSVTDERMLHQRFATYRQKGEWFTLGPELCDFILEKLNRPSGQKHLRNWLVNQVEIPPKNPWDDEW